MIDIVIEFLTQDLNGKVITKMYISSGNFAFPDSNWTDFAAIVLNWWVTELIGQVEGNKHGKYSFMDGPFFFETEWKGQDRMHVCFKERRLSTTDLIYSVEIDINDFLRSLKQSVNIVLREYHKYKLSNPDIRALELNYSKILMVKLG